jgi:CRP-like cAMP-binding protein
MTAFKKNASCFNCDHKLNLFCFMTDEQLKQVDDDRQEVNFNAGETVFKKGGPLTHMLCITKGKLKIYLEDDVSDKRILLRIAKPVEIILGSGFLVDNRYHLTAVALEDTTACYIQIEKHKRVMMENPEYGLAIVKHLNEKLLQQFDKMMSLANKHTHGKLAEALLYLSENVYSNPEFDTKLSRQDIGDLCGMTKETTIRTLKDFTSEGLIECDNHHFKLLNIDKLKNISKNG